jgi:Beta-lactamase enzyme family
LWSESADASEAEQTESESESESESETESEANAPLHLRMRKWDSSASGASRRNNESEFERTQWPDSESDESLEPEQQVATPRPRLARMAFLARFVGPLDPGFYDAAGKYVSTPALQTCVDTVKALPAARGLQFAIVDFTKGLAAPEFAGVRHTEATAIGSVGKIMAMYAAFQLQNDLRVLKAASAPASLAALITAIHAQWSAAQVLPASPAVTAFAGDIGRRGDVMTWKGRPLDVPSGTVLPDVKAIFQSLSTLNFDSSRQSFLPGGSSECDEAVVLVATEHMPDRWWRVNLPFLQRMRMMIGLSDNRASGTCIDDIGSAYINAVLVQSGLWHPARNGGLWLAGNYAGRVWRKSPLGGFVGNGTAGALAAFLTLLARQRLVSAPASTAMRSLLDKNTYFGALTRSPVAGALRDAGRDSHVWSKLGLLDGKVFDAAIVERTEGGKALKYAVVILNSVNDAPLAEVAVALDNCIRRNNGLP